MSHLATFLSREIKAQKTTARAMAEKMGLHEAVLSGILKRGRTSFNMATAVKICNGISPDPEIQTKALTALLADHGLHSTISVSKAQSRPIFTSKHASELIALARDGRLSDSSLKGLLILARELIQ